MLNVLWKFVKYKFEEIAKKEETKEGFNYVREEQPVINALKVKKLPRCNCNLLDRLEGYGQEITDDDREDKKNELEDVKKLISIKDKNQENQNDLKDIVTNDEIIQV